MQLEQNLFVRVLQHPKLLQCTGDNMRSKLSKPFNGFQEGRTTTLSGALDHHCGQYPFRSSGGKWPTLSSWHSTCSLDLCSTSSPCNPPPNSLSIPAQSTPKDSGALLDH